MARPKKARNRWTRWIIALGVLLTLAVVGHVAIRFVLSTEFLQERFSLELAEASDGLYKIRLGSTSFDLIANRMHATDVALYPDSARLADTTRRLAPEALYSISAPSLTINGTSLLSLLQGKIKSRSLHLTRPHLHLALDNRRARPRSDTTAPRVTSPFRPAPFHHRLAKQVPRMEIGVIRIDSAAFSWERIVDGKRIRDSVGSINVELHDINTDSASVADTSRVLFSNDVRFRLGGYARMSEDGVYLMSVDSISGSTKDRQLLIQSMQFVPILSDSQLKRKYNTRTTRYSASASNVELRGLEYRKTLEENAVDVRSMLVRKPVLDIYLDRTLPPRTRAQPSKLPHESLRGITWNTTFDTVRFEEGRVVYSERAADGARRGMMRFEEFAGEMRNISNTPELDGKRARMDIRTRLNGAAELVATIDYDMSRPELNMSYQGSITSMDATSFNEVLVDLEGIRVQSGQLDSAWFAINVVRNVATGSVLMRYHNLKVSFENKNTGGRGIFNRIKTFVANAVKLRDSNPTNASVPATVADVRVIRSPEVPLFGFMWQGIRAGLLSTLGM